MSRQIDEKIKEYFEGQRGVVAIYLFGSYAEGKDRQHSDVDIGILFERIDAKCAREKIGRYVVELSRVLRKDIHPVILNTANDALLRQIFEKGRCLVVNDSKKMARYLTVQLAKITDFAYYRKMMQTGLIRKIMEDSRIG